MLNAFASLKCSKKCQHNVQNPKPERHKTTGSLRNEDGDDNEDFILKYEFALFISLRNYFMSFRVKNV